MQNEVCLLGSLSHPNIMRFMAISLDPPTIVMQVGIDAWLDCGVMANVDWRLFSMHACYALLAMHFMAISLDPPIIVMQVRIAWLKCGVAG